MSDDDDDGVSDISASRQKDQNFRVRSRHCRRKLRSEPPGSAGQYSVEPCECSCQRYKTPAILEAVETSIRTQTMLQDQAVVA